MRGFPAFFVKDATIRSRMAAQEGEYILGLDRDGDAIDLFDSIGCQAGTM